MKRLVVIGIAAIVSLTLWLPVSADAAVLSFDYIQHRKYEDGSESVKLLFSFQDQNGNYILSNILKSVQLFDPSGTELQLAGISFSSEKTLYGYYDSANGKWTYGDFSSEGYYSAYVNAPIVSGQYRLKVTDTSDIVYEADKTVSGAIVGLPIISSKSFYAYRDGSGNLIWTWSRPSDLDPGLNTSVRAFIQIYNNDQYIGELYVTVPTHLGYLFVPNAVYQKLLAEGNILKLGIQLRTTDNLNRSYSNFPKVEEAGTPFFDINGDGKMGLPEIILILQVIAGLR